MGPGVSGGTISEGLERGYRFGIICSGDNHYYPAVYGNGLMACYAKELTREALWEAFHERRVYGVSADRVELHFTVEGAMMGSVIRKKGRVRVEIMARGSDAIDRIELLRNLQVIATYCHNGTWDIPTGRGRIRCKLRVEAGWGQNPQNFGGTAPQKPKKVEMQGFGLSQIDTIDRTWRKWECSITVPNGKIISVEKCWRKPGQYVGKTGSSKCEFGFYTGAARDFPKLPTEATIFELEARPSDKIHLNLDGQQACFTLDEAMHRSQIVWFRKEVEQFIRKFYRFDPGALPRDDQLYFLSHKAKIHRAIPEDGYVVEFRHTDVSPPPGRNFYRVRIYQRNGSVAWSSPVWVEA